MAPSIIVPRQAIPADFQPSRGERIANGIAMTEIPIPKLVIAANPASERDTPGRLVSAEKSGGITKSAIGPAIPATNAAKRIAHRYR
jgi:hypothetical protein